MTNEKKYATPEERVMAHGAWCHDSDGCRRKHHTCRECFAHWLALEAEAEKPEPCFYCGHEMHYRVEHRNFTDKHWLECTNGECNFESPKYESKEAAISAHNRTCKAVATYVANGGANDKMLADMLKACDILCPGHGGFEEKCLNCKCKALCDKYRSLQLEISEYRKKVEIESEAHNG